ncbi:intradiol ring-cleavage dioxygenase [Curvibacter sp. CHRR-16]|uniref:dioxygenase family protein n=1 Tax=Curvibacter sp. CHRR-16 TaxID=2835872 RepID=UPI001BD96F42|nr:intradiol ring-cleavage dioxygenase [Curvibacter sp. CHRR-16]MBT0569182.1 intradiol ring-cleavage dioxygenase [Curvibacter sp. CHRR-16]
MRLIQDFPHLQNLFKPGATVLVDPAARRLAMRTLGAGAAGLIMPWHLAGCGGGGGSSDGSSSSSTGSSSTSTCSVVPSETVGPYPGDGSNTLSGSVVNVLTQSGVVRSDITSSFGSYSGTATGVPLTLTLTLLSASSSTPLVGYAIYVWHCDKGGNYSLYNTTSANYLRGVQVTDSSGQVTFTTIFPGCYTPRWPHIHFEVYASETLATTNPASDQVKTSQLALPESVCDTVYATSAYSGNASRFGAITLATDMVFSDICTSQQMATVTGSVSAGYTATITVAV